MPRPKKQDGPSKSDFIRRNPTLSVGDLVKKAKEAGIDLSKPLIYGVRARAGKTGGKRGRKSAAAATTTPAAAPAKPGRRGRRSGNSASAFIRTVPSSVPVKEVVEMAAAQGFKIKPNLVYGVRAAMNKGGGAKASAPASASTSTARTAGRPANEQNKAAFRKLMIRIGLDESEALYNDVFRELRKIEQGS